MLLDTDVSEVRDLPSNLDVLFCDSPCQDVSIRNMQRSKHSDRPQSHLVFAAIRLMEIRKVPILIFENVPGCIQGAEPLIASLCKALEALGCSWVYRVLSLQAFGIPQRRKRLFMVAWFLGDPCSHLLAMTAMCKCRAKEQGCFLCASPSTRQSAYAMDTGESMP